MDITFDAAKRLKTLEERGLDFNDAARVFIGPYLQTVDDRKDYGEVRYLRIAKLGSDVVMTVWTPRDGSRRIISMRKCDADEKELYETHYLGGP